MIFGTCEQLFDRTIINREREREFFGRITDNNKRKNNEQFVCSSFEPH